MRKKETEQFKVWNDKKFIIFPDIHQAVLLLVLHGKNMKRILKRILKTHLMKKIIGKVLFLTENFFLKESAQLHITECSRWRQRTATLRDMPSVTMFAEVTDDTNRKNISGKHRTRPLGHRHVGNTGDVGAAVNTGNLVRWKSLYH
jgi:hypothetical protein